MVILGDPLSFCETISKGVCKRALSPYIVLSVKLTEHRLGERFLSPRHHVELGSGEDF